VWTAALSRPGRQLIRRRSPDQVSRQRAAQRLLTLDDGSSLSVLSTDGAH